MHEWGITESVIKEIIRQANENNLKKIDKVWLSIGKDTNITSEDLEFCFKNLAKGTILETAELKLGNCEGRGIVVNSIEGEI